MAEAFSLSLLRRRGGLDQMDEKLFNRYSLPSATFIQPQEQELHIPRLCGTVGTGGLFFDIRKSAATLERGITSCSAFSL